MCKGKVLKTAEWGVYRCGKYTNFLGDFGAKIQSMSHDITTYSGLSPCFCQERSKDGRFCPCLRCARRACLARECATKATAQGVFGNFLSKSIGVFFEDMVQ